MSYSYKLLTNLLFEPKGKHDPDLTYNIKDTVMSADGRCVYFALKDVPVGIALDDVEYWIKMLDVSDIQGGPGGAVWSVNGKTGEVILSAADVGALPKDTPIPIIPLNVSAFVNDVGYLIKVPDEYITEEELNAKGYITQHQDLSDYAKKSEIPNVSAFITRAVSDLENYYLKSQTYNKTEIDNKLSTIPKFSISVVSTLPSTGISTTTIYLVPGGVDDNLYTEYININGNWEILGSQRVDLTGYATQSWTLEQLKGKLDANKLPEAINAALEQAKESGEFDGEDGGYYEPNVDAAGNLTWIPSKDGMFIITGQNIKGPKGDAGTSVTIEEITQSTEPGGENVVKFSDENTLTINNGKDGYTPVRGVDYYTEADKEEMVQAVSDLIANDDFITYTNLFDKTKLRTGGLYNGDKWSSGTYTASAPIYLTTGDYLFTNRNSVYGENAEKAFKVTENGDPAGGYIQGAVLSDEVVLVSIITEGYYAFNICKSISTSTTVDTYMLVEGSTLDDWPPKYVSYGEPLKVEKGPGTTYSENPLYRKIAVFDGDSICDGGSAETGSGWASRIGEANKMTWHNAGVGGGTIISGDASHCISTNLDAIYAAYPNLDYLILEGGTNDADILGAEGLGTLSTSTVQPTDFDPSADFTQAMEYMCSKAITLFPTAQIGFIVAQKMGTKNDYATCTRRVFFDRAVEVCKKYGIPVLDLWNSCHLHPKIDYASHGNAYYMYTDGQHLSDAGYEYITSIIEAWMKTMYSQQASIGGSVVDQEEIVQQVIAALPVYNGEVV